MTILSKISYFAPNGDTVGLPYIIYPEGIRNRKPYGKGFINLSVSARPTDRLLEAMIEKYDFPESLKGSEVAWYLTSRKVERLINRFGKTFFR